MGALVAGGGTARYERAGPGRRSPRFIRSGHLGPTRRKKTRGRTPKRSVVLVLVVIPFLLLLTMAAGLIPALVEESRDLAPAGPVSNNCSINLGDNDRDIYWTTLTDASEGSVTDPDEAGVTDDVDGIRARVCNSATFLFLWGERRGVTGPGPGGLHFYLDTTGDSAADYDLLLSLLNGTVGLYAQTGTWTWVPMSALDRVDLAMTGFSIELGIELALIGNPQSLFYYVTSETDGIPDGAFLDRMPDAGFSGSYAVPSVPAAATLVVALIAPIIALSATPGLRRAGRPSPGSPRPRS